MITVNDQSQIKPKQSSPLHKIMVLFFSFKSFGSLQISSLRICPGVITLICICVCEYVQQQYFDRHLAGERFSYAICRWRLTFLQSFNSLLRFFEATGFFTERGGGRLLREEQQSIGIWDALSKPQGRGATRCSVVAPVHVPVSSVISSCLAASGAVFLSECV